MTSFLPFKLEKRLVNQFISSFLRKIQTVPKIAPEALLNNYSVLFQAFRRARPGSACYPFGENENERDHHGHNQQKPLFACETHYSMYKLFHHFGLCHGYLLLSRQSPTYPDFQPVKFCTNLVNCLIQRLKYHFGRFSGIRMACRKGSILRNSKQKPLFFPNLVTVIPHYDVPDFRYRNYWHTS